MRHYGGSLRYRNRFLLGWIVVAGFLVAGCGNGGDAGAPTASDFEGLWLITSITADVGGSMETRDRDGTPLAVRGDVFFTPATNETGTLSIRQVLLDGNVPQGPLLLREDAVELDEDRWVLTEPTGDVSVYLAELDGDALTLTWDEDDPRNASTEPPPSAILADRAPPWGTSTVGTWRQSGECLPILTSPVIPILPGTPPLALSARYDSDLIISSRHIADWTVDVFVHLSSDCSGSPESFSATLFGLLEEEGDTLRTWWPATSTAAVTLPPDFRELEFSVVSDVLSMTSSDCDPTPGCIDSPKAFVLQQGWTRSSP